MVIGINKHFDSIDWIMLNNQRTLKWLRNQSSHISVTDIMITSNIKQKITQYFFLEKGAIIKTNWYGQIDATNEIYVWTEQSQFEKYNLPNDKEYVKNVVYNEIIDD